MLYVLIFLSAMLAFEGVYFLMQGRRLKHQATMRSRLRKLASKLKQSEVGKEQSILRSKDSARSAIDRALDATGLVLSLQRRLYRAGLTMTPRRFVMTSIGLALGGWAMGSLLSADPLLSRLDQSICQNGQGSSSLDDPLDVSQPAKQLPTIDFELHGLLPFLKLGVRQKEEALGGKGRSPSLHWHHSKMFSVVLPSMNRPPSGE